MSYFLLDGRTLINPLIQAKHKRWIVTQGDSEMEMQTTVCSFGQKRAAESYIKKANLNAPVCS